MANSLFDLSLQTEKQVREAVSQGHIYCGDCSRLLEDIKVDTIQTKLVSPRRLIGVFGTTA